MLSVDPIFQKVGSYNKNADLDLLRRAYEFAERAHEGQQRKSGEPYFLHPIQVAHIIADLRLDVPSICAAFLHDTVEDTVATIDEIAGQFGGEIAEIVDGVTKLSKLEFSNKEERQADNFRKMIVAMAKDIRVLLVKLADRTHNMRTLEHMAPHKQERIAQETLDIYAPLANRLGIQWMKIELEDLSFRYLNADAYRAIADKLQQTRQEREQYIDETLGILRKELDQYNLRGVDVYGRPKHIYSIYKKMQDREMEFEQLHDVLAFRIIVDTVPQCYEALGVIHNLWKPLPGRFKDYIALPKPNQYQSLHTAVVGHKGERLEVQIRTQEMHRVAEDGIAAHWVYKEGRTTPTSSDDQKFAWLRQLMEWQTELTDPTEFMETVRVDLFSDEVYVFTPRGDVIALPQNATPIDFAFGIHTQVGEHCVGAKVNGRMVQLRHELKNGDIVEILTSPHQKPSKDWLKFATTSRAKAKIRHSVRLEERARARDVGLELLDKELRRYDLSYSKLVKGGKKLDEACRALRVQGGEEMLLEIGYGKLEAESVAQKLVPEDKVIAEKAKNETKKESFLGSLLKKVTRQQQLPTPSNGGAPGSGSGRTGIRVQGLDDVLVRFGRCCNPVPGDEITGFITRGRGITVHAKVCQKGLDVDPARRIDVQWEEGAKFQRTVAVKIISSDKPGLLASMSQVFTEAGINIAQAYCRTTDDHRAVNTFEVTISDSKQLKNAMRRIEQIAGIVSVERVNT